MGSTGKLLGRDGRRGGLDGRAQRVTVAGGCVRPRGLCVGQRTRRWRPRTCNQSSRVRFPHNGPFTGSRTSSSKPHRGGHGGSNPSKSSTRTSFPSLRPLNSLTVLIASCLLKRDTNSLIQGDLLLLPSSITSGRVTTSDGCDVTAHGVGEEAGGDWAGAGHGGENGSPPPGFCVVHT